MSLISIDSLSEILRFVRDICSRTQLESLGCYPGHIKEPPYIVHGRTEWLVVDASRQNTISEALVHWGRVALIVLDELGTFEPDINEFLAKFLVLRTLVIGTASHRIDSAISASNIELSVLSNVANIITEQFRHTSSIELGDTDVFGYYEKNSLMARLTKLARLGHRFM